MQSSLQLLVRQFIVNFVLLYILKHAGRMRVLNFLKEPIARLPTRNPLLDYDTVDVENGLKTLNMSKYMYVCLYMRICAPLLRAIITRHYYATLFPAIITRHFYSRHFSIFFAVTLRDMCIIAIRIVSVFIHSKYFFPIDQYEECSSVWFHKHLSQYLKTILRFALSRVGGIL